MAIKTFTSGEVLTASNTNTYLANSGWVYVNSGTFTGQTAIQVNSVFTTTYSNYKLVFENIGTAAGTHGANIQLTSGGTASAANYAYGAQYWTLANTPTTNPFGMTSGSSWDFLLFDVTTKSYVELTMYAPQIARTTAVTFDGVFWTNTYRTGGGIHNVATSYDGFKLTTVGSTISGTWSVYGQRNA